MILTRPSVSPPCSPRRGILTRLGLAPCVPGSLIITKLMVSSNYGPGSVIPKRHGLASRRSGGRVILRDSFSPPSGIGREIPTNCWFSPIWALSVLSWRHAASQTCSRESVILMRLPVHPAAMGVWSYRPCYLATMGVLSWDRRPCPLRLSPCYPNETLGLATMKPWATMDQVQFIGGCVRREELIFKIVIGVRRFWWTVEDCTVVWPDSIEQEIHANTLGSHCRYWIYIHHYHAFWNLFLNKKCTSENE